MSGQAVTCQALACSAVLEARHGRFCDRHELLEPIDHEARADKAERDRNALLVLVAELLGSGAPWPLTSVLSKLAAAATHLLQDHDCDRHGYEEVDGALRSVPRHLAAITAAIEPLTAGRSILEAARGPIVYRTAEGPNSKTWTAAELLDALGRRDEHAVTYFRQMLAPDLEAERVRAVQAAADWIDERIGDGKTAQQLRDCAPTIARET